MTTTEIIQAIRNEIERRIKIQDDWAGRKVLPGRDLAFAVKEELKQLLSFLSTLEVEEYVELSSSVDNYPKNVCPPSVECERGLRESLEEPTSEELEEEIPKSLNVVADYARRQVEELLPVIKKYNDYSEEQIEELRTHLMAMFLEGAGWQKKQILKEAVDAIVENWNPDPKPEITIPLNPEEFTHGDKVRVIIIPNTDEK